MQNTPLSDYAIINTSLIRHKIEDLKSLIANSNPTQFNDDGLKNFTRQALIDQFEVILSQTTELVPEIKKAFNAAREPYRINDYGTSGYSDSQDYVSQLKINT